MLKLLEPLSKGNQIKFYKDGYWVKLDNYCEGLAEEMAYMFSKCMLNFESIPYKSDTFIYEQYTGCMSQNMYGDASFISLRSLLRQSNLTNGFVIREQSIEKNITNTVNYVRSMIGLDIFMYLNKVLFFDALICNEDRHPMNLGVCLKNGRYVIAPCFDNGSSLFCVKWCYKPRKSLDENLKSSYSSARPFSKFFDVQIDALLNLGAENLVINRVLFEGFIQGYSNALYDTDVVNRAKAVILDRVSHFDRIIRWV